MLSSEGVMRKIVRRFKDMSINKKLYFTILCCLIFPLIIVFCFMNGVIGKEFRESQQDKELEILKQSKPVVENVLNDIEMISRDILGNDYTQTLLEYYGQTGEYEENARVQLDFYLRNLMSSREYLSSVSVYKDENILLQCGNYFEKESTAEVSGLKKKLILKMAVLYGNRQGYFRIMWQEMKMNMLCPCKEILIICTSRKLWELNESV